MCNSNNKYEPPNRDGAALNFHDGLKAGFETDRILMTLSQPILPAAAVLCNHGTMGAY